jgi:NTE family protein
MPAARRKTINLALQGGGAHGAFTWGILDAILEDGRLDIDAISGTSAGAMNAVAFADGMLEGGPEGARAQLEAFWRSISDDARLSPIQRSAFDHLLGAWSLDRSPGLAFFDVFTRVASPYAFNPLNLNPIRDLLAEQINFENVRRCEAVKLFISATNVETGLPAVFDHKALTADHVMASACLPMLFQAVIIDGVPYWDGGFTGNPALYPLYYQTSTRDILLVQINPVRREGVPRTAREIDNRLNEITFNTSLLREFRAIAFVRRLIDDGLLSDKRYARVMLHRISGDEVLKPIGASSKLNAEWAFFQYLKDAGRTAAQAWLAENFDAIGERSTFDVMAEMG